MSTREFIASINSLVGQQFFKNCIEREIDVEPLLWGLEYQIQASQSP